MTPLGSCMDQTNAGALHEQGRTRLLRPIGPVHAGDEISQGRASTRSFDRFGRPNSTSSAAKCCSLISEKRLEQGGHWPTETVAVQEESGSWKVDQLSSSNSSEEEQHLSRRADNSWVYSSLHNRHPTETIGFHGWTVARAQCS
jgi:hypothetical protein